MSQRMMSVNEVRELAKRQKRSPQTPAPEWPETDATISVRLPFPPPLNRYYRTAVVSGHAQTYISARGKQFRKSVIAQWAIHPRVRWTCPLAMRIEVWCPDARNYDVDGCLKALLDALEHAGAYANDNQVRCLIVEMQGVSRGGYVHVTIGPRPGDRQGTLFETVW
jgi:crossover junction endodeoxyribonuclease RusA